MKERARKKDNVLFSRFIIREPLGRRAQAANVLLCVILR